MPTTAVRRKPARRRLRALALPVGIAAAVTASVPGWFTIRIHSGDTLSALAARYHTTVQELVALNHLPGNGDLIYAGATLKIPRGHSTAGGTRTTTHVRWVGHTVVTGDTVDGLAQRYHTTRQAIAARNHLPANLLIRLGQRLQVPVRARTTTHVNTGGFTGYPVATMAQAARHRAMLARRSVASRDQVRSMLIDYGHQFGVDPALALAISWQESGFNQHAVSAADAVGAMQVIPSTGQFVSQYVVHRRLDLLSARDNVVAGVALLGTLTHAAPVRDAVAGYYQGLGSVRAHGMYADTKRYVANVMSLRAYFAHHL